MNARNQYNALIEIPKWCQELMWDAERHGAWETGIESDKKQRGSAINCDLYGYDEAQRIAVVQVREAVFHPRRHTRVRKDYYLIGYTEAGGFFAHPVESPARSSRAMASPEACVRYVLAKIWNCREADLDDIERQGDVAFIPVTAIPSTAKKLEEGATVTLRDSHQLTGELWKDCNGTYYTRRGARLLHLKRQHKTVRARAGLYRVQEGVRAEVWGHTTPVGD